MMREQIETIELMRFHMNAALAWAILSIILYVVDHEWLFAGRSASTSQMLRYVISGVTVVLIGHIFLYHHAAHRFDSLERPYLLETFGWPPGRTFTFLSEWCV
jgi:hypothetical protein